MPNFKENTSPAMKRSGFKMKGYSYPGTSPMKDTIKEKTIDVDEIYENKLDEGIKYKRGSKEEQEVIRRQWGDVAGPPVREEDKSPLPTRLGRFLLGRKKHTFDDGNYTAITDRKGRVVKHKQVNPDGSVTTRKRSLKDRKNQRYQ